MLSSFTKRLNEAFRFFHLTQKELADSVGISKALMNQYFKGLSSPKSVEKVVEIADILKVNPAWLAGFDEPVKQIKLTDAERELVEAFRELSEANQNLVVTTIRALPKEEKTTKEKIA